MHSTDVLTAGAAAVAESTQGRWASNMPSTRPHITNANETTLCNTASTRDTFQIGSGTIRPPRKPEPRTLAILRLLRPPVKRSRTQFPALDHDPITVGNARTPPRSGRPRPP